jgi:peptide/nickel transport system ATP-binding protein
VGPGFVGEPPQRPHGKNASAPAGELGEDAEEAEATVRARHHEHRDETSEPRAADNHSHVAPFRELEVGDGRQADDADVPSAFEPTEEENEEGGKKK